jgi:septum site-determining protein MinC
MTPKKRVLEPVQFKSLLFDLLAAKILDSDVTLVIETLSHHFSKAPDFFLGQPLVLDLNALPEGAEPDLLRLADHVQQLGVFLAGMTVPLHLEKKAMEAGIPLLSKERLSVEHLQPTDAFSPSLVIEKPIRSGQKLYAENGDLILMDVVNAGAEVVADGHIHSYAPLRGRAFAGASGKKGARIFSQIFEAELVSIAGVHQTLEKIDASLRKKSVHVYLDGNSLHIDRL